MAFAAKILSWRFRHLNIVGCLLKRRPTKGGGSRAPQNHPPSNAPVPGPGFKSRVSEKLTGIPARILVNFNILLCLVGLSQQSGCSFKFVPKKYRLIKKDAAETRV